MASTIHYRVKESDSETPIWASEPFRIFFPLGILASILGTMIWPLFYAGVWPFAPNLQHPRMMIFGFGFAFVAGFLGTAWPRFLEARAIGRIELGLLVVTWLTAQVLYALHELRWGDGAFAVHALTLSVILLIRLKPGQERSGGELPSPGFVLAISAVLLGGSVALVWALFPASLSPGWFQFTKLVAWQGLLLIPLLGVGSYLFARFFQTPGKRPPTANSKQRAIGVWAAASLVMISFAIEAAGWIRIGNLARFGAILVWTIMATPALYTQASKSTRPWALRIAIGSIALTFLIRGIWPGPAYAITHILFLAGFGLAMLLAADRVSLGHGGDLKNTPPKSPLWRWLVWLMLLGAATRVSADMKASILVSHHIYAAITWIIIALIWVGFIGRFWLRRS